MAQTKTLTERAEALFGELHGLPLAERIEAINRIRRLLHAHSPFAEEPVDCVQWVRAERVAGNDYNPNTVAPPEMRLLRLSIESDGFTQPIVAYPQADGRYEVVDGFHRLRVGSARARCASVCTATCRSPRYAPGVKATASASPPPSATTAHAACTACCR